MLSAPESSAPEFIIIATGSEVWVAMEAAEKLKKKGKCPAVVSMPSVELFTAQSPDYQKQVLFDFKPPVVVIEAGSTHCWSRFTGPRGLIIGMDTFGASAPNKVLAEKFGFTPDAVAGSIETWLEQSL